jgi:hypothetical protein
LHSLKNINPQKGVFMNFYTTSLLTLLLAVSLPAFSANQFGFSGSSGRNGQNGFNGKDGQSTIVKATGQTEQLILAGSDGGPGNNGGFGSDAYNCYQGSTTPNYDLYGANGGEGGDGGNGGYGGDGGNIRVYFQNLSDVKNIFVDSSPGQGSYSGRGEYGGRGCRCTYYAWTKQECHQEAYTHTVCLPRGCQQGTAGCNCQTQTEYKTVCVDKRYTCRDGYDGRQGYNGRNGSAGSYGSIQLVGQLTDLAPTTPSMVVLVDKILTGTFNLSRDDWDSKSGALSVFAPGSKIRDDYKLFAGTSVNSVNFTWLDQDRSPSYYAGSRISLSLVGKPAIVKVALPTDLLAVTSQTGTANSTDFQFTKTMRRDELTNLRVEEMTGSMETLTLTMIDDSNVSDVSNTKVFIESGWELEAGGKFKDWVPQNLIRSEKNKVHINLGRIPGIKAKKLKKYFGEKCELEMYIDRAFAGTTERVRREGKPIFDVEKDIKRQTPIKVKMEN